MSISAQTRGSNAEMIVFLEEKSRKLEEEKDRMREALLVCTEKFLEYARIHTERGHLDKANTNLVMAQFAADAANCK